MNESPVSITGYAPSRIGLLQTVSRAVSERGHLLDTFDLIEGAHRSRPDSKSGPPQTRSEVRSFETKRSRPPRALRTSRPLSPRRQSLPSFPRSFSEPDPPKRRSLLAWPTTVSRIAAIDDELRPAPRWHALIPASFLQRRLSPISRAGGKPATGSSSTRRRVSWVRCDTLVRLTCPLPDRR